MKGPSLTQAHRRRDALPGNIALRELPVDDLRRRLQNQPIVADKLEVPLRVHADLRRIDRADLAGHLVPLRLVDAIGTEIGAAARAKSHVRLLRRWLSSRVLLPSGVH